jgi:hypothetical protein
MLNRIRAQILTGQYWRLIRLQFERFFVGVLLFGTVETGYRAAIVITAEPLIAHAEFAFAEFGFLPDSINRTLQDFHVYPVYFIDCLLFSHFMLPPIILKVTSS